MSKHKRREESQQGDWTETLVPQVDLFAMLALVALLCVLVAFPFINPEPKDQADKRVPTHPVTFYAELEWTPGQTSDVDLWVNCRSHLGGTLEVNATVGWPSREDLWLVFTHDDLGRPSVLNYELVESTAVADVLPPNTTCTLNSHLFQVRDGVLPISAELKVIYMKDSGANERLIARVPFMLTKPAEEVTLVVFSTDEKGVPYWDEILTYPQAPNKPFVTKLASFE